MGRGVRVYVGQTRARWLTAELATLGWGECTNRGELPPRRVPWFMDNGAFGDWKAERPWNEPAFRADLDELRTHPIVRPDFIVAPDIVAGGVDSLDVSRAWVDELQEIAPVYVAVQDGMIIEPETVRGFDGIFVGGTLEWKISTGQAWVGLARKVGIPLHVGRVGTGRRVRWAQSIYADSIDSSLPLWSADNLRTFRNAIERPTLPLFPDPHGAIPH